MTKPTEKREDSNALADLKAIRTETVLSRLPVHNLIKGGTIDVQITRRNPEGEVTLQWSVVYSRLGQPKQLAYKIDTLVVNRRIDEERTSAFHSGQRPGPIPKQIRLGSLGDICKELGSTLSGANRNAIREALQQNAATFIQAKLGYTAQDGGSRWLDAFFNRYNVIFTGERFADGRVADAVYIVLSDTYWEVLNRAPFRPLDYNYLRELAPMAQRFYEILSFRFFAAIKNGYPTARIPYSEYCLYTAQTRYHDYDHFKKQMYKVHLPHLKSGYVAKVVYEDTQDGEGKPDWLMIYTPGPKAKAEYAEFGRKGILAEGLTGSDEDQASEPPKRSKAADPEAAAILGELAECGLSASWAKKYVASLDARGRERSRDIVDYFRFVLPKRDWENPAGVLRRLLEADAADGVTIPEKVPTRSRTAAESTQQASFESQIEREAIEELERQRKIESAIDAALSQLSDEDRGTLHSRAEAKCAQIARFSNWAEPARKRELERQVRKLVLSEYCC